METSSAMVHGNGVLPPSLASGPVPQALRTGSSSMSRSSAAATNTRSAAIDLGEEALERFHDRADCCLGL